MCTCSLGFVKADRFHQWIDAIPACLDNPMHLAIVEDLLLYFAKRSSAEPGYACKDALSRLFSMYKRQSAKLLDRRLTRQVDFILSI